MKPEKPNIMPGTHPVETRKYILSTPMLRKLREVIFQWIARRHTGGIIWGTPRDGKTRCRRYIMRQLPEAFPNILAYNFLCRKSIVPTENSFFTRLLISSKNSFADQGFSPQKRDRLTDFLKSEVERSGQDQIVLAIDEAQRLTELQYDWLIDVYNELDEEDISVCVLLFGQPELLHIRTSLSRRRKKQIADRFMTEDYHLTAVKTKKDLAGCLGCYDETAWYPNNMKEWPYTRFFLPDRFDQGWRFAQMAPALWQAFEEVRVANNVAGESPVISMQVCCRAMEAIVLAMSKKPDEDLSAEYLCNLVIGAGYGIAVSEEEEDEDEDTEAA